MNRLVGMGIAVSMAAGCGAAPTTAADVTAMLAAADAEQQGYAVDTTLAPTVAALIKEEDLDVSLTLQPNTKYRLIGRCAEGCTELGLISSGPLADGTGQDIYGATDEASPSAEPAIDFTTLGHGKVRLTITLFGCPQEKCLAGVRLYKFVAPTP